MTLTVTGLFVLVCIVLGVWLIRKKHHKKREFFVISLFWILLVATPWGAGGVAKVQGLLGNGIQAASSAVNSVSSK